MPRISPFKVALACGAAGAYVDVTAYASWAPGEGVAGSWGKQDQFRDTTPGAFSIYLDNYDGRFTPDTTNGLLSTPLTEGMGVSWQLGTRVIAGQILGFAMIEDNWGRIRVDVDDMLGDLARNTVVNTVRSQVFGAAPYLYWPFNDAATAFSASEQSGNLGPAIVPSTSVPLTFTFAQPGVPGLGSPDTQALVSSPLGSGVTFAADAAGPSPIQYPSGSLGAWGLWFTPVAPSVSSGEYFRFTVTLVNGLNFGWSAGQLSGGVVQLAAFGDVGAPSPSNIQASVTGVPLYLSIVLTTSGAVGTLKFYINGVLVKTNTVSSLTLVAWTSPYNQPAFITFRQINDTFATSYLVEHLSHTQYQVDESPITAGTEAGVIAATVATTPSAALGTLPTDLSTAPAQPQSASGSALAKLNDVIRTEQGYLDCVTTGTLLAPVQAIRVRARTRSTTVSYSFDAQLELSGQPDLIRDLTNLVASVTAQGPTTSTIWLDATVSARAGSANTTDQIVSTQYVDQLGYAQDRVNRGKNTAIHAPSFTVDALHTPTDRSADLLAIKFGDRVQITNIPTTVTNFGTVDMWVIGRTEAQDRDQHKFTFYVQPVLAATAIYDTNRYMADGALTLSAGINAAATSMSVATTGPLLEQVDVPYDLLLDSEQVTVTACNGATPQVATITRAVNGTVAASHTTSATIEIATPSLYAF